MERIIKIGFAVLLLALSGCKKDLPRDNPYDSHNPNAYQGNIVFTQAVLTDDQSLGNTDTHNGQVNIYERIKFKVYIKNTGLVPIKNATATVSDQSPVINGLWADGQQPGNANSTSLSFGDIQPGAEVACNETIDFDVNGSARDNDNLPFTLNIQDDAGQTQYVSFSFTVAHFTPQYNFKLLQPQILSGQDGPNDIFNLGLKVQNTTGESTDNISATYSYNSKDINFYPGTDNFGSFSAYSTSQTISESVLIYSSVPDHRVETINVVLNDMYGNQWQLPFQFTVQ